MAAETDSANPRPPDVAVRARADSSPAITPTPKSPLAVSVLVESDRAARTTAITVSATPTPTPTMAAGDSAHIRRKRLFGATAPELEAMRLGLVAGPASSASERIGPGFHSGRSAVRSTTVPSTEASASDASSPSSSRRGAPSMSRMAGGLGTSITRVRAAPPSKSAICEKSTCSAGMESTGTPRAAKPWAASSRT